MSHLIRPHSLWQRVFERRLQVNVNVINDDRLCDKLPPRTGLPGFSAAFTKTSMLPMIYQRYVFSEAVRS